MSKIKLLFPLLIIVFVLFVHPISAASTNFFEYAQQDDARITFNGSIWDYGNDYVQAGSFDSQHYMMRSGMRFNNVQIPPGQQITDAYITFTAAKTDVQGILNTVISGQLNYAGLTLPFTGSQDFFTRQMSVNSVSWTITETWQAGSTYRSPNLNTIIKEITTNNWVNGNSIVLFWGSPQDDLNRTVGLCRRAFSYTSGGQNKAPVLTLVYSNPVAATQPAIITIPIATTQPIQPVVTNTQSDAVLINSLSDSMTAKLNSLQSSINTINNQVSTLTTNINQIPALQTSNTGLNTAITGLKTDIGSLRDSIASLKTANEANNASILANIRGLNTGGLLIFIILLQFVAIIILIYPKISGKLDSLIGKYLKVKKGP